MNILNSELYRALQDIDSSVSIAPEGPELELSTKLEGIQVPPIPITSLGSRGFLEEFNLKIACTAGSMANAISSVELVTAMAENGCLASFGAAGLSLEKIQNAIAQLQQRLGNKTFASNLIHSPGDSTLEWETARFYVDSNIPVIEVSAFLQLTPAIILCRASGLRTASNGSVQIPRRIIAKVSRREIAVLFLRPAPAELLDQLVSDGSLTREEADLAARIPVCDALTVEADSGGHTDSQPLVTLLPSMLSLREELFRSSELRRSVYIGAAGGIGTPEAISAAFAMGADFVTTGSINQACVEAGTSDEVKLMLTLAKTTDVSMAPAADMFAMGVKVQVLKQGCLFPMRAQKLYELYRAYNSLDDLPDIEVKRLEDQIFLTSLDEMKRCAVEYTRDNYPDAVDLLIKNPREMMLRVFLWYMSQSSSWATSGDEGRKIDYQIWCGPAMGAFNAWVAESGMAEPEDRKIFEVSQTLMRGAAYLLRLQHLRTLGYQVDPTLAAYRPGETNKRDVPVPIQQSTPRPSWRKIASVITEAIADQRGVPQHSIDVTLSFNHFEMDSLKSVVVLNRIEKFLGRELSPTLVWNYPTIQALANHLASEAAD